MFGQFIRWLSSETGGLAGRLLGGAPYFPLRPGETRGAAEVGFSTLDWIVQLLELHAEQDEEDEPEDEE